MINTFDIKGYPIDEFNVHGLKEGASSSTCPLCSSSRSKTNQNHKCTSLDWELGLGHCHHCSETFQLHTFKRKGKSDKEYLKPKPPDNLSLDNRIVKWFEDRGISKETLDKARITTSSHQGRSWMEFNYYYGGELVNRKSRDAKKNFLLEKGCELIFYNIDSIINSDYCVIVEGEIDVLSYMEAGVPNVVSVPNGANNLNYLDNTIDCFSDKDKIILAVDTDEAGQKLQKELIRRLGSEKCHLADLGNAKDANEFLTLYGAEALHETVEKAVQIPLENVNTAYDVAAEVDDFFKHGGPKGYGCGIPELDDIFTVLPGQYCVVTAVPTAGKTFFIDQWSLGVNKLHGWKIAVASPETKPDWVGVANITQKLYNDFPSNIDTYSQKYRDIQEVINENFFYIDMDSFTLDNVLKKATELVKRKGIKMLVIDPINRVRDRSNESIAEYTIKYFTKVDEWAKRHNVFVMLAAHPHKIHKLDNGEWPDMNYYNIAGGADIANMAYHILAMNRSYSAGTTSIKVLKCKYNFLGKNGEEARFNYDVKSTNFIPLPKDETAKMLWD